MTMRSEGKGRVFELVAGHPALDLVNTLDWRFRDAGPEELLQDYRSLLRFARQSNLLDAKQAKRLLRDAGDGDALRTLAACRELREAAAEVFYAAIDERTPSTASLKTLDGLFKSASARQKLRWKEGRLQWRLPEKELDPEMPLWMLALSAAGLMTSPEMARVRACASSDCRWLFLDTSKNHTRRWCDMKICGNRMNARRFKALHAA